MRKLAALAFVVFIAFMAITVLEMHDFGHPPLERDSPAMDDYIIEHAQNETGANNVVTSVVFDYRAFDTLGEATVLFTAVAGVMALFRRRDTHD